MPGAKKRYYQIYITMDVSSSMQIVPPNESQSPHDRFLLLMPGLMLALNDAPEVRTTCWMSVIAFASQPQVVLPITSLRHPSPVGELPRGGATDFAAVLQLLRRHIDADAGEIQTRGARESTVIEMARPLIFFITDGRPERNRIHQPESEWGPARDALTDTTKGARIATVGLAGADERVLWRIATGDGDLRNAFVATREMSSTALANNIIAAIQRSVIASVQRDEMVIETPEGMRRVESLVGGSHD